MNTTLNFTVNEIFQSIQGEGLMIGVPMNFIRFCSCNLSCCYCDTNFNEGIKISFPGIIKRLKGKASWVSLTGGEPMLEENLIDLILDLKSNGFKILLETNGTIFDEKIFNNSDFISADIKGPSSGNPGHDREVIEYCMENSERTQIKVLIQTLEDFEFFLKVYRGEYPNWILQPEWGSIKNLEYGVILEKIGGERKNYPADSQTDGHKMKTTE